MIRHFLKLAVCWTIGHRMGYRQRSVWAAPRYGCLRCGWDPAVK